MKAPLQRSAKDHLRLEAPMLAISGDRDAPLLPVAEHLRPLTRYSACVLYSRVAGVFPGNAEVLPLHVALATLVAGEA